MKHTAGPWTVSGHHVDNGRIQIGSQKDYICELYWEPNDEISKAANWTEAEANAKLIASAPDMLETLKLLAKIAANTTKNLIGFDGAEMLDKAIDHAKAAIAKAEGN